jgi:hypothetical protein
MADPMPMNVVVRQADSAPDVPGHGEALDPSHHAVLTDEDPLGVDEFATHRLPLAEAPAA